MIDEFHVCPFCKEDDFDTEGLAYHLRLYCKQYEAAWHRFNYPELTEAIDDEQ